MQNQNTIDGASDEVSNLISIGDLVSTLWRSRWTVLIVTVLTGGGSLLWAQSHGTYKSQGFFQFGGAIPMVREKNTIKENSKEKDPSPGIALTNYKSYAAAYATSERFSDFIHEKKLESVSGVNELNGVFNSKGGISRLIEPIFLFTKLDAKEFMAQPKDSGNNVIGLNISYETTLPETAQKTVGLLGRYAMDSIVYSIYSDELRSKQEETRSKIARFDNLIITSKSLLDEYRQKVLDLKQIIARNPIAKDSVRQVITVTEDTARYLPPITQLMTTEVEAAETNQIIFKAKREQRQQIILFEYYSGAKGVLDGTKSGESILRGLELVKAAVFKDKNLQDDVVKEVYNSITNENLTALNLYFDRSRFIAGPTFPQRSTARPLFMLGVGLLSGFLLSLVIVLGRKWWKESQARFP